MNFKENLKELFNWFQTNNITLIEGDISIEKSSLVSFTNNNIDYINNFKKSLIKLNNNVVFYELVNWDIESYNSIEVTLKEINDEELNNKFSSLINYKDENIVGYFYSFFNGICLKLNIQIDEIEDYIEIVQKSDEFTENKVKSRYEPLSTFEIKDYAEILAENEEFPNLKNRTLRERLARSLFYKELATKSTHIWNKSINEIVIEAEIFYENELKFQKEYNELEKVKILNLEKKLAENTEFQLLKKRELREKLASELYLKDLIFLSKATQISTIKSIVLDAEQIYNHKILPQKDLELKEKVQKLLNMGITKVKISAELGISIDKINKFL